MNTRYPPLLLISTGVVLIFTLSTVWYQGSFDIWRDDYSDLADRPVGSGLVGGLSRGIFVSGFCMLAIYSIRYIKTAGSHYDRGLWILMELGFIGQVIPKSLSPFLHILLSSLSYICFFLLMVRAHTHENPRFSLPLVLIPLGFYFWYSLQGFRVIHLVDNSILQKLTIIGTFASVFVGYLLTKWDLWLNRFSFQGPDLEKTLMWTELR